MNLNIAKEVAILRRLPIHDLRAMYPKVFGQPTRAANSVWLVKRIAGAYKPWPEAARPNATANAPPSCPTRPICASYRRNQPRHGQYTASWCRRRI